MQERLFAGLLSDSEARVRYFAALFLLQRLMAVHGDAYRTALRQLVVRAQQVNDEKMLDNPFLQVWMHCGVLRACCHVANC